MIASFVSIVLLFSSSVAPPEDKVGQEWALQRLDPLVNVSPAVHSTHSNAPNFASGDPRSIRLCALDTSDGPRGSETASPSRVPARMPWWLPFAKNVAFFACLLVLLVEVALVVLPAWTKACAIGENAWEMSEEKLRQLPLTCVDRDAQRTGQFIRRIAIAGGFATVVAIAFTVEALLEAPWLGSISISSLLQYLVLSACLAYVTVACYRLGTQLGLQAARLTLSRDAVTLCRSGATGQETWTEPLTNYNGLLGKINVFGTGESQYAVLSLALDHPNPERSIPLIERRGPYSPPIELDPKARHEWKSYARLLGVPALRISENSVVAIQAEDLDKSAGELVQEGKRPVLFDVNAPVPEGIEVEAEEGYVTLVTVRAPAVSFLFRIMLVGVGLTSAFIYASIPYVGMPIGLALVGLGIFWKLHDTRLRISGDAIQMAVLTARDPIDLASVDPGHIEDVVVSVEFRSGKAIWRNTQSARCLVDEFIAFFDSRLATAFQATARQKAEPIREQGAVATLDEEVEEQPPARNDKLDARSIWSVLMVMDDDVKAVPTRMSPEAAQWLRDLILSLLATR